MKRLYFILFTILSAITISFSQKFGIVKIDNNINVFSKKYDDHFLIDTSTAVDLISGQLINDPVTILFPDENICKFSVKYFDPLFGGEFIDFEINSDLEIIAFEYWKSNGDMFEECSDGNYPIKNISIVISEDPFMNKSLLGLKGLLEITRDHIKYDSDNQIIDCREYHKSDEKLLLFKFINQI